MKETIWKSDTGALMSHKDYMNLSDTEKQFMSPIKSGDDNPVPETCGVDDDGFHCQKTGKPNSIAEQCNNGCILKSTPVIEQKERLSNRNAIIGLLENYSTFLAANGYMDEDWRSEPPYAIDEFLKLTEPESKQLTPQVTDGYTREEVFKIVANCCNYFFSQGIKEGTPYSRGGDNDYVKWFEKNVPLPKPPQVV